MIDEEFEVSTDRTRLNVDLVHRFLSTSSYWAHGRTLAIVRRSLEGSLCFGAYRGIEQIGFCRVVTDYAVLAYLADMFVLPEWRRRGVGKMLMEAVIKHGELRDIQVFQLRSRDARQLYARFGFRSTPRSEEVMSRYASDSAVQHDVADGRGPRLRSEPRR